MSPSGGESRRGLDREQRWIDESGMPREAEAKARGREQERKEGGMGIGTTSYFEMMLEEG